MLDAITDVGGVEVGQTTILRGDNIRTGVTAILPHAGNLYREKVPAGIFVGNGFGKLAGSTQVEEMGNIETPILLTSTTSVPRVEDAVISYMLSLPGNEEVLSINPVVGETNDGYLNDIRGRHIAPEDVFAAIRNAHSGPVEEGSVGGGILGASLSAAKADSDNSRETSSVDFIVRTTPVGSEGRTDAPARAVPAGLLPGRRQPAPLGPSVLRARGAGPAGGRALRAPA